MRHPTTTLAVLLLAGLAGAGVASAQTVPGGFAVGQYGGANITNGTAMAWAPDGRLFVCEQGGAVRVIKSGALLGTAYHTATVDFPGGSERGLLGIALDPNFSVNGYVYIYYTNPTPAIHNCIRRLQRSVGSADVSDGTETVILDLENLSATNHNGGAIHFGPDGKLYVAVGENAVGTNAQSITTRLGKILRYNPDGSIPADNPASFPGIAGTTAGVYQAIWAVGLRNPYTFSFQPGTGRMFINDVGQNTWEEINDGIAGSNYGWPTTEGMFNPVTFPNFRLPLYTYNHSSGTPQGIAITGGTFYNPSTTQFPAGYVGKYFFADYGSSWIYYIDPASPGTSTQFLINGSSPVDIQVGSDGGLYYLARGGGSPGVYRVIYTAVVVQNIITSTNVLSVSEGSTATFNVRLAINPGGPLTVNAANTFGSASVTVAPALINFTTGNWNVDQLVTVTANADPDVFDNGANITLSSAALAPQTVVVTTLDSNAVANHPTARISLPVNGQTVVGATAEFFGNGTPIPGFATVQADFYIDGVLSSTDAGPGHYHFGGGGHNGWNTTGLTNGTHILRMTVTDNNGVPRTGSHEIAVIVSNAAAGAGGGGGGGGGCGATGLEPFLLLGLLVGLRRFRA